MLLSTTGRTAVTGESELLRAELVASARRLIGVRRSFDERSFLGHILKVNAMLPSGAQSASLPVQDYRRLALSSKRMIPAESALPGDIVFFECNEGCGEASAGGVAAGVIERVHDGRLEFISYADNEVKRCNSGSSFKTVGVASVTYSGRTR